MTFSCCNFALRQLLNGGEIMGQIVTGKFIATGSAVNMDLGFIPAYARFFNANGAVNEVMLMEYFNLCGDAQEFWKYAINDQGTTTAVDLIKKASSGYVSEYDTVGVGAQKSCTFDDTGGAAVDLITCTVAKDVPVDGDSVKFIESGGLPTTAPTELPNYYVIDSEVYGAGTFRISATPGGSAVDFGGDGTPANYFINVSKGEPIVTGGKGLTLSGTFGADGDVIFFVAIEADVDKNFGDAADW